MNNRNLIPGLIIFGVFLVTGIWTGRWLGRAFEKIQPNLSPANPHSNAAQSIAAAQYLSGLRLQSSVPTSVVKELFHAPPQKLHPRPQQRNILIIGVDHLDNTSPELESVWLLLYLPDLPHVTLMPIYPEVVRNIDGAQIQADRSLEQAFRLGSDSLLSPAFEDVLKGKGLWWHNYIILDQVAIVDLIDAIGGLKTINARNQQGGENISGVRAFAHMATVKENPRAALQSQAQLAQYMCRTLPNVGLNLSRVDTLLSVLTSHLETNLEPEQVIDDFNSMLSNGGGLVCEFPSLTLLSSK